MILFDKSWSKRIFFLLNIQDLRMRGLYGHRRKKVQILRICNLIWRVSDCSNQESILSGVKLQFPGTSLMKLSSYQWQTKGMRMIQLCVHGMEYLSLNIYFFDSIYQHVSAFSCYVETLCIYLSKTFVEVEIKNSTVLMMKI